MIFRPNPGLIAELEAQGLLDAYVQEKAEELKAHAESIAPRGETGYYADHFVLEEDGGVFRVGNTDFAAHWVEWGSIHNPPYATLRRAVQATRLHLRETPKP